MKNICLMCTDILCAVKPMYGMYVRKVNMVYFYVDSEHYTVNGIPEKSPNSIMSPRHLQKASPRNDYILRVKYLINTLNLSESIHGLYFGQILVQCLGDDANEHSKYDILY